MTTIVDTGVQVPSTVTFGSLAIKADYLATDDKKHYTKVNTSQSFCHEDRTIVNPSTSLAVVAKVCTTVDFVDPTAP